MEKGALRERESLPWGKRRFWHGGPGRAPGSFTSVKRFSIKKPHCITNADVASIKRMFGLPPWTLYSFAQLPDSPEGIS